MNLPNHTPRSPLRSRQRPTLLFCLLVGLLFPFPCVTAQITSGTIDYNVHRYFEVSDWMDREMQKKLAERRDNGDFDRPGRVSFTQEAFAYSPLPREKPIEGRMSWYVRDDADPDIFYTNYRDSTITHRRKIMDRKFIMADAWAVPDWDIPANQQPSMAYTLPSEVAFATSPEGDTLTAYFTRTIPLPIGPQGYGGLPGAIVYLKVQNEGRYTEYTMTTMQPNPADLTVDKPEDGDAISREKFEKLRAKREEAMARRRRGWQRN